MKEKKKKKKKGIFLYSGPLREHRLDPSTFSYRYRYRRLLLLLMKHTSLSFIPLFFYALVVYDIGLQSWWHRRPLKAKADCPASSDQVLSLYKKRPPFSTATPGLTITPPPLLLLLLLLCTCVGVYTLHQTAHTYKEIEWTK